MIEEGCKVCQCIQNYYSCDDTPCKTTTILSTQTETIPEIESETTERKSTVGISSTGRQTVTTTTAATIPPFIVAVHTLSPIVPCEQRLVLFLVF